MTQVIGVEYKVAEGQRGKEGANHLRALKVIKPQKVILQLTGSRKKDASTGAMCSSINPTPAWIKVPLFSK